MLKGHLDMIVLAALAAGPAHGYAVIEEIKRKQEASGCAVDEAAGQGEAAPPSDGGASVGAGLSTPVHRALRFAMPPVAAGFAAMMSPALPRCPILACARPQGHAGRHASADPGDEAEG